MPPFLLCIHDATPAFARETRQMIADLAPLVGRRISFGVVPNWGGEWPLSAHREYCALLQESSDELLLHGYFHRRQHGWGPASLLAEQSDEMNGLDREETRQTIERGQHDFREAFGAEARAFLAPAWQTRHVHPAELRDLGLDYLVGFFAIDSVAGGRVPLATFSWDCGRWSWLGHVGHGIGTLLHLSGSRIPVLAIHPRDLERGFWPQILGLTRSLLNDGYQPVTVARLAGSRQC